MATLNISDLSVGDWLQDNYGNYVKVMGIWQGSNFNYQVDLLRDGKIGTMTPCNIRPIPITAEILENNGIHKTYEDDDYAIFRGDGLWVVKYSDGDWELSTPPSMSCRHQIRSPAPARFEACGYRQRD